MKHANSFMPIQLQVPFQCLLESTRGIPTQKGFWIQLQGCCWFICLFFLKKNLAHYIKIRQPYLTD